MTLVGVGAKNVKIENFEDSGHQVDEKAPIYTFYIQRQVLWFAQKYILHINVRHCPSSHKRSLSKSASTAWMQFFEKFGQRFVSAE